MDFEGASGDRGLRGIAIGDEEVLIAGSDVLFRCGPDFSIKTFSRNRYLDDCHEICRYGDKVFLTSPGFDSLLAFDLGTREYIWGYHLIRQRGQWAGHTFDPRSNMGPVPVNDYHINMVHVDGTGIYFSGLRTEALLHLGNEMEVSAVCSLPGEAHNARPYRDGVLLNDTGSSCVRYAGRDGTSLAFRAASFVESEIEFSAKEDTGDLRQGFARGLCVIGERFVAAGFVAVHHQPVRLPVPNREWPPSIFQWTSATPLVALPTGRSKPDAKPDISCRPMNNGQLS